MRMLELNVPGTFRRQNIKLTKLLTNGIAKVLTGYELPDFFYEGLPKSSEITGPHVIC